jgi:hypothetical protein
MGTYYRIANLDKREWIHPHRVSERQGAKLWEIAHGDAAAVLVTLLADEWKGDRIALYSDAGGGEYETMDDCAGEDGELCWHKHARADRSAGALGIGIEPCWREITAEAVKLARERGMLR